jgi:hypothetical protein
MSESRRSWLAVAAVMFGVGWGANQFTSLLIAYHQHLGLAFTVNEALFGIYALGLIPALLVGGPASDCWGRQKVVRPAAVTSMGATVVLMVGAHSTPWLFAGRFLAGAVSGAVFAAGTAWVKELSVPPFDLAAGEQSGARRAAIGLSAGFGLGPLAAGLIAQWAPAPLVVSYLPHLAVMALVLPGLWQVPETVPRLADLGPSLAARLRVPAVSHQRFLSVVVPVAPWVFGAASVSFAVLPSVVSGRTQGFGIAFAGLIAALTLGVGVAVQPVARRLDRVGTPRSALAGLTLVTVGMAAAALAAELTSPLVVVVASAMLGGGYGVCLVGGLLEVQRIAGPGELAGLNAVFYALTYVGFALPIVVAELARFTSFPVLLLGLTGLAAVCLAVVAANATRAQPP